MATNYKTEAVAQLAAQITAAGFRAFIAESGTHGFFTDEKGSRVVSFQYDLGGISFSGNYRTDSPRTTGTGWRLEPPRGPLRPELARMFGAHAPQWAVGSTPWRFTTLAQYLATYQKSSQFVETARV